MLTDIQKERFASLFSQKILPALSGNSEQLIQLCNEARIFTQQKEEQGMGFFLRGSSDMSIIKSLEGKTYYLSKTAYGFGTSYNFYNEDGSLIESFEPNSDYTDNDGVYVSERDNTVEVSGYYIKAKFSESEFFKEPPEPFDNIDVFQCESVDETFYMVEKQEGADSKVYNFYTEEAELIESFNSDTVEINSVDKTITFSGEKIKDKFNFDQLRPF